MNENSQGRLSEENGTWAIFPKVFMAGEIKEMIVSFQPTRQAKGVLQPKRQLSGFQWLAVLSSVVHWGCMGSRCRRGADRTLSSQLGPRICCTMSVDSIRKYLSRCDGSRFGRSFFTLLLKFKLHTIKCTHFQCTVWSVWLYLYSCMSVPMIWFSNTSRMFPHTCLQAFLNPTPGNQMISFLSLWFCLFWIFHTKKIAYCMFFCDWLLSLNVIFF